MADPENAAALRQPLTNGGQVSVVDVAEDSSLGCCVSVVLFTSLVGGIWMFAHYMATGSINMALVILFFSSMAIIAMGAVVYSYLQASGRLEAEEAEQHRVERFRHYARQRMFRGQARELSTPASLGGVDARGNASGGAYGSCDPASGAVLTGNIYTATVSPHAFVVQKDGGAYKVLPASGYPATSRSPSPLEAVGVAGVSGVEDLPPVLAMPVGMPIYTPFVAAPPEVQVAARGHQPGAAPDQQWASQPPPGGPVPGLGGHVIGIAVQPPYARPATAPPPAMAPPPTAAVPSTSGAAAGPGAAPVAVVAGAPAAQNAGMPQRWAGTTGNSSAGSRLATVEEMRQQALRGQVLRPGTRTNATYSSSIAARSGRDEAVAAAAGARLERLQTTGGGERLQRIGRLPLAPSPAPTPASARGGAGV